MNETALMTFGILLTIAIACALVAIYLPRMRRPLSIAGYSFALLIFGGWVVILITAAISHRHLNSKGILMLLTNVYMVWMILQLLSQEIRKPRIDSSANSK